VRGKLEEKNSLERGRLIFDLSPIFFSQKIENDVFMEKKKHRTKLKKPKVNQTSIGNDFFAHKVQKRLLCYELKKLETNSYSQMFGCLDQTQISLSPFIEKKEIRGNFNRIRNCCQTMKLLLSRYFPNTHYSFTYCSNNCFHR